MDIQKEREAFKEYIISKHKNRSPLILTQRIQHGFSENYIVQGVQDCWETWQAAKAQAVPEGFVLIKDDTKTVVAIEQMVEQQVEASGMDSRRLERLDGWKIIEAAVKAQEPQITELKVEWASDCFKCGHHEAIIYSTAAEASTKGWFHDGDEVKCTGCGNTGEMDARGEDSDICWNEDEAND